MNITKYRGVRMVSVLALVYLVEHGETTSERLAPAFTTNVVLLLTIAARIGTCLQRTAWRVV